MRERKRILEIIGKILLIWQKNPDFRFFQLISYIESEIKKEKDMDLFYLEDNELEKCLKKIIDK